jgi:hypothetical protein
VRPISIPELPLLGRHWIWDSLECGLSCILNEEFQVFRDCQHSHFKFALDAGFSDSDFLLDLALFTSHGWIDSHLLACFLDRSPQSIRFALRFELFDSLIKLLDEEVDDAAVFCLIKALAADRSIAAAHPELPSTTCFFDSLRHNSISLITILTALAFRELWTHAGVAETILTMLDWNDASLRVWTILCYGHCVKWKLDIEGWEIPLLENQCESELEELAVLATLTDFVASVQIPPGDSIFVWFEEHRKRKTANFQMHSLRFFASYLATDPKTEAVEIAGSLLQECLKSNEKQVKEYAEECSQKWMVRAGNAVFEYATQLLLAPCFSQNSVDDPSAPSADGSGRRTIVDHL